MLRAIAGVALLAVATTLHAEVPVEKVRIDTHVVDRVLDASRRSAPADLLRRIVLEDIEMLRGARPDGMYDYAFYDRFEADRHAQSFSIEPKKDDETETVEVKGSFIYRLMLDVPSRRLLVTRNRRVWVERVEVEFIPQGQTARDQHVVEIKAWMEPGSSRTIDLPQIGRQVTARVVARGDTEAGYGNLVVTTIEARIIDDAKSPYASAVSAAKQLLRAIDAGEPPGIRNAVALMRAALPAAEQVRMEGSGLERRELQSELELIEDLLTGNEAQKLEGLERLHQLVRRVRVR